MDIKLYDLFVAFLLNFIHTVCSESILSCDPSSIEPCAGRNQICDVISKHCDCIQNYTMIDGDCEIPGSDYASTHSATATIVTIFTICLLVGGLVLIVRKYNLIEYVTHKLNLRRNHEVMYEDVMIGQDDPPINP